MAICEKCIHNFVCKYGENRSDGIYCTGEKCKQYLSTADFVEVVRCKDCTHKIITSSGRVMCKRNATKMGADAEWCGLTATDNNHYCNYGERKDK